MLGTDFKRLIFALVSMLNKLTLILALFLSFTNARGQQTVGLLEYNEGSQTGYTLLAPMYSPRVFLLDNCGEVVHHWTCSTRPGLSTYLQEDGLLLRTGVVSGTPYGGGGIGGLIERYNWDGSLNWSYTLANDSMHAHHDVALMPNGNILVLLWGYISESDAISQGRIGNIDDAGLWPPMVMEIAPIGVDSAEVVWQWNMKDHLIQNVNPNLPNYGALSDHPELMDINYYFPSNTFSDWLHCNSIDYNANLDQVLISSRNLSEVFVIDHSTTTEEAQGHSGGASGLGGDLLYRYGNPQNYGRGEAADQVLFLQHDAQWIKDGLPGAGSILLFNNEGSSDSMSSVDTYLPPLNNLGQYDIMDDAPYGPSNASWIYDNEDFFSSNISGAQRLENGNTLICSGREGRLFEVSDTGTILWEYVNPVVLPDFVLPQGTEPELNHVFQALRYPPSYAAFDGQELVSEGPLEMEPITSECVSLSASGAQALDFEWRVFSEHLEIHTPIFNGQWSAELIDLTGKQLTVQTDASETKRISMSGRAAGLYVITVSNQAHRVSHKIFWAE